MAAPKKPNKPVKPAYSDYYTFPGPYSMGTRGEKSPRKGMAKAKPVPKLPKRYKANPGF